MSKIFEALLRSVAERSGSPLSEAPDSVTELLQQTETFQNSVVDGINHRVTEDNRTERLTSISTTSSLASCSTVVPSFPPESRAITVTDPGSVAAENFRLLAVRLRNLGRHRELKRVLVTSAIPDEGKSVIALNLAVTFARYKQLRVLLVEGDLRRPEIRTSLRLPAMNGLSEWLLGEIPTTDIIHQVSSQGLTFWLLPAGGPLSAPLELMQSDRLAALMDNLSESFDWIIIDSTPILPVADTSIWARLTQGILMVVREGKTERRQLQKALDGLDVSTLLGFVVNGSSKNEHESYYMYYGSAHNNGIHEQEG